MQCFEGFKIYKIRLKFKLNLIFFFRKILAIAMASTQIEESYSCDSSYYKSTDRISSPDYQQQIFKLNNIKNKFDGVNSTIRENAELDGLNITVIMLAH